MKKRVLFVCLGNACRSQMAEGFARAIGDEFWEVASAGLMPLDHVPSLTRQVMLEREIPIDSQYPKGIEVYRNDAFDVVVNMSGTVLPRPFAAGARQWIVADPYGRSEGAYRQVRDDIEGRVQGLLQELRQGSGGGGEGANAPEPAPGILGKLFGRKS